MVYSSVLVICPGNAVTAGPEALHQLVAELNGFGKPAAIVYHPFDRQFAVPEPYRKYDTPVGRYADEAGTLIIFPEIFPTLALRVRHARAAIWWMSVNNYTCVRYESVLRDKIRYTRNLLLGRRPWRGMSALRSLKHFAQSHYAESFLAGYGIKAAPLSDPIPVYLEPEYLEALAQRSPTPRKDIILYNPTKGAKVTARLREAFPQWQFRPLRGLNRVELAEAFLGAKVYIDFGHHPGKDRLPREAAIHGCCVMTGRNGSAADSIDVPIPERYKFDPRAGDFVSRFEALVSEIFRDFESCSQEFSGYRDIIRREPETYRNQVKALIDEVSPQPAGRSGG
ncbi:MAG: hypothetical protein Q8M26_05625 [Pseudolabrys sp.]|nr:hypothetical protein [Pseudolabrys sp.]